MKSSQQEATTNMLTQNSPQLIEILKKTISSLTPEELKELQKLSELESEAKKVAPIFADNLTQITNIFSESVTNNIKKLDLSSHDKKLVDTIFKETLMTTIRKASDNIYENLSKRDGVIYNTLLSETIINIMEAILKFKNKIDEKFPGITDAILSLAAPAITLTVAVYSPPMALILQSTGIVERATDFLKTENLENAIAKMREDLAEIQKDKQLKESKEKGEKLAELAEKIKTSPIALNKLDLPVKETIEEISTNPEIKPILQKNCEYAEKYIPNNKQEVEEKLTGIKEAILKQIQDMDASEATLKKISEHLDKTIASTKDTMEESLNPNSKIYDKIAAIEQSADVIEHDSKNLTSIIGKNEPKNLKLAGNIIKIVKNEVDKTVRGNSNEMIKQLASSHSKKFAREALGVNHASMVTAQKQLSRNKTSGTGRGL